MFQLPQNDNTENLHGDSRKNNSQDVAFENTQIFTKKQFQMLSDH